MAKNPFAVLEKWLNEISPQQRISVFVSVCDESGYPNVEVVDQVNFSDNKLVFKSDCSFDKKNIAICVYIDDVGRQIRIEGVANLNSDNFHEVKMQLIEFWQKGKYRLHDRNVYNLTENGFEHNILYP